MSSGTELNEQSSNEYHEGRLAAASADAEEVSKLGPDESLLDTTTARNNFTKLPDVTDKGYAWVTVGAMFLSNVITAGYIKSFGVTYNAVVQLYPGTSASYGSVIMGLLSGCRSLLALVVGAASVQFGYRRVMLFGSVLCATGLFASYFAQSIPVLAITLGACMGCGMCCVESPQVIVLAEYFNEKKELGNSLRVSGNPLGGAVIPFTLVLLFDVFGVKISFIYLSAIYLQLVVISSLIRPYKTHQIIVANKRLEKQAKMTTIRNEQLENERSLDGQKTPQQEKAKKFDIKLLRNPLYLTYIGMIVLLSIALPQVQYFVPLFGKSIGMSPTENSVVLAYQSVSDSIIRLIIGAILNKKLLKPAVTFSICLGLGGLGICFIPLTRNLWTMLATITLFSMGSAGFFAISNCLLVDQFGKNNISSSWGFMRMTQGVMNFVYPSMLGALVDVTGDFVLTFITMGVGMAGGGLCIALQPCVLKCTTSDDDKETDEGVAEIA